MRQAPYTGSRWHPRPGEDLKLISRVGVLGGGSKYRANPHARSAIAVAEIAPRRRPPVWREPVIGRDGRGGSTAASAGRCFRMPATKCCARSESPCGPVPPRIAEVPSGERRLKWMCVPLPIPCGSSIGAKIARCPRWWAVARAISRRITASSAARTPSDGAVVTSYWRGPYSGRRSPAANPPRVSRQ